MAKAKNSRGRPSDYSPELGSDILERLVDGESLRSVCRDESMPSVGAVLRWVAQHDDFRKQYEKATDERASGMFEDMVDIADEVEPDSASVAKARLRVDTRKWILSRMNPKKYGDKLSTELTGANGGPVETVNWTASASDDLLRQVASLKGGAQ